MINREIAKAFSQIADLMELKGEDRFRTNAYRTAARALLDLTEDIAAVARRNGLTTIAGIGKGTAAKIQEYISEGQIGLHQELLAEYPPGLRQLLDVRGLGPKKVDLLYRELKVASPEELRAAIADGRLQKLKGFGEKTAKNILEALDFLQKAGERTPLGLAAPIAAALRDAVSRFPGVGRAEVAGSLRRGRESVADIDLLCEAADGASVIAAFTRLSAVADVLGAGETKASVVIDTLEAAPIQADLRVVPAESFGAALQYFTGSKEHNVRLREMAVKRGWRLNEYGLFEGDRRIAGDDEAGVYAAFGLPLIPPELREDRGEIEAGGRVANLVDLADIRGELHAHTTATDGLLSAEEMVEAARKRGYQYLAITDHSRSSAFVGGLSPERLLAQAAEVRALDRRLNGFDLLAGTECDILPDGSLDYADDVLAQLDWVVASIHAAQRQDRETLTRRTIRAIENPHVCVIGHPSGRLLGKRDAMDIDWEQVIAAAAKHATALEVNASWQRLDLNERHVRMAMDAGCWISINTDAHSADDMDQMTYGVKTARRGWATTDRILNCLSAAELRNWVAARRRAQA